MQDYDQWNHLKQKLNQKKSIYVKPRQIWWTHVGLNIGHETNGHDTLFLRPVLVLKVMTKKTFLGIPMTTKKGRKQYQFKIASNSFADLNQLKIFDTRRVYRFKNRISPKKFDELNQKFRGCYTASVSPDLQGVAGKGPKTEPQTESNTPSLKDQFETLNPPQRQAVERIYGPTLVIAGPGTGKTQLLTLRIAHILQQTDADPRNILCLTFTESGAKAMRERLSRWIGPAAYQVQIQTFHGFCDWILRSYSGYFDRFTDQMQVADDLQKALTFRKVHQSKKWEYFTSLWDEYAYQNDILQALSQLKREHLTPEKLRALVPQEKKRLEADPGNFYKVTRGNYTAGDFKPQKRQEIDTKIGKMLELADFWECWDNELRRQQLYDFDDMIQWVVEAVTNSEDLRYDLQEQFQWLLVDEYQDTNDSQNALLWALTRDTEEPNIFAVGDDDQSIYRFQGASLKNMMDFQSHFPTCELIQLADNYRSIQPILDAAYTLVQNNQERLIADKKLQSQVFLPKKSDKSTPAVLLRSYASLSAEYQQIGQQIKKLLDQGVVAEEIAVLVRNNHEIGPITQELSLLEIPASNRMRDNIFENSSVLFLLQCLQFHVNITDDNNLFELLHHPVWNIPPRDLLRLSLERHRGRTHFFELWIQADDSPKKQMAPTLFEPQNPTEGILFTPALHDVFKRLATEQTKHFSARPRLLIEAYLSHTGLASYLQKEQKNTDWMAIKKLLQWSREQAFESIEKLLDQVKLHQELNIALLADPLPAQSKAVQIMTAHKSKGLEFDHVFIPSLWDKKWGNQRSIERIPLPDLYFEVDKQTEEKNKALEDERRLFFVALTRARQSVYLSFSETDFAGRAKTMSQLASELPENITPKATPLMEDLLIQVPNTHNVESLITPDEQLILGDKIKQFIWSATSLQDYLDCPRKFLYRHLYKYPAPPKSEPQLALGTALHQALEQFFKGSQSSKTYPLVGDKLLHLFDHALRGQSLEKSWFLKLQEHGQKILTQYYAEKLIDLEESHPYGYELEFDFGRYRPVTKGIRLTGKLDKITYLNAEKNHVCITDYKSGKPKTIKPGERLWRQLVFYDLLVINCPQLNWLKRQNQLEFLTPDTKGIFGVRSHNVTEEDRKQVLQELQDAQKAIEAFNFPEVENPSEDPVLDYWNHFGKS